MFPIEPPKQYITVSHILLLGLYRQIMSEQCQNISLAEYVMSGSENKNELKTRLSKTQDPLPRLLTARLRSFQGNTITSGHFWG